ncbi:uncharacterized protein LOC119723894 [Patiria miniata]|uniref:Uncharacterized protein n=1 Tax=Patiria miniata TaxID=46514 RepID=A0A913ZI42_PATMI|nr:uncharacterized protein LOC119723894 [Patiria miniata]XP_038050726.1 uncharacterized protein LOC119723894 [Patiria miniata]
MVFDQTVYVCNASAEKVYVRTTYEKWQQLKFSTEVKLLSGTSTGGGFNFEQASDFTEGFTALAPHHTLKMIGSFFSAEADDQTAAAAGAGGAGAAETKRVNISRNYRVPNRHAVIVTPQMTLQVVRGGDQWNKRCQEFCPFVIREKKRSPSLWQRLRGTTPKVRKAETCQVCGRGGRSSTIQ